MLLKAIYAGEVNGVAVGFSTLYRVDAIEGESQKRFREVVQEFQYPLSGRCY